MNLCGLCSSDMQKKKVVDKDNDPVLKKKMEESMKESKKSTFREILNLLLK